MYVNQRQNCDCGSPVYEVAFCNDCNEPHLLARDKKGKLVQWERPAYASLENRQATVRLRKSEVRFGRQNPSAGLSLVARAGGMIVGSIKLDDSEIAIGEVPLTFIVDADQWLLQGQASCSVRSSDVLIVLLGIIAMLLVLMANRGQ